MESGFSRAAFTKSANVLERTVGGDDQRIRRVVEKVDRRDVLGLELRVGLERLQHDVRQVHADHRVAVARHAVHLRPDERAAGAGLVDDDHLLSVLRLEHLRLEARGNVGFARRGERDDVLDRLVRISESRGSEDRGGDGDCDAPNGRHLHALLP
jgi:hypothetical protein